MANIENMGGNAAVPSIDPALAHGGLVSSSLLSFPHSALTNTDGGQADPVGGQDQSSLHAKSKKPKKKKSRHSPSPGNDNACHSDDVERKRGCESSSLSPIQQQLVRDKFPAWELLLEEHQLQLGKFESNGSRARDPEDISTWIDSTVERIRTSPAFGTVNDTAEKTIKDMFRNYRNNTFIKKNQQAVIQKAIAALQDKSTPSTMEAVKAANALVSFQQPAPAKDLFRIQNHDAIQQEADKLRAAAAQKRQADGIKLEDFDPRRDDNRGGFYQRALSELWSKADQVSYKDMVKLDVFANQEIFPAAIKTSLQAICDNGAVGPMELILLVGYRNAENRTVTCQLNAHHINPANGIPPPAFLQRYEEKVQFGALKKWWWDYCETHIPAHTVPEVPAVSPHITVSNGIPVLAGVDLAAFSASEIGNLMIEFLSKLWYYSWPKDQERASIPLAEIKAHPDDFYDTKEYSFVVPFTEIETLKVLDIMKLATYLLEICGHSCSKPFTFRTKEEIARRTVLRLQREELEQSTGEEIVMSDVFPPAIPNANVSNANVSNANISGTNISDPNVSAWGLRSNLQTLNPNTNNGSSNQGLPMAWENCSDLQPLIPNTSVSWEVRSDLRPVPDGNPMSWEACSNLSPNSNFHDANIHGINGSPLTWNAGTEVTQLVHDPSTNIPSEPSSTAWGVRADLPSLVLKPNTTTNHFPMAWEDSSHLPPVVHEEPKPVMREVRSEGRPEAADVFVPSHPVQLLPHLQRPPPSQPPHHLQRSPPLQCPSPSQPLPPSQPLQRTPLLQSSQPALPVNPHPQPLLQTPSQNQMPQSVPSALPYLQPTSQPTSQMQTVFDTQSNGPPVVSFDTSRSLLDGSLVSPSASLTVPQNGHVHTVRLPEYGGVASRSFASSTNTLSEPSPGFNTSSLSDPNSGSTNHLPMEPEHGSIHSETPPINETGRGGSRRNKTTVVTQPARDAKSDSNQVRKSSRIRSVKRKNSDPVTQPQPRVAKKQKQKQFYSYLVPQSDGRVAMVEGEGEDKVVVGYVNKDLEGDAILVDGNGVFKKKLPKAVFNMCPELA
ncbi:hypothetical protein EV361DRAFT_962087 [Lentinula raphanica]|nr:hypothetical protein EV361DRAFT_962087 [Lentinula raphanica]